MNDDPSVSRGSLDTGALGAAMLRAAATEQPAAGALDRTLLAVSAARLPGAVASGSTGARASFGAKWMGVAALGVLLASAGSLLHHSVQEPAPAVTPLLLNSPPPVVDVRSPSAPAPVIEEQEPVVVPPPTTAARHALAAKVVAPKVSSPSLSVELAAVDAARASLERGDARGSLVQLDAYDRAFPHGAFRPEASLVRIGALLKSGDGTAARSLADQFLAKDPSSPYADRIRSLLAEPSNL